MPRIQLQEPFGMNFAICTRQTEVLKAWFDEVLPYTFCAARPGVDDFKVIWPRIMVYPMWAWGTPNGDPDWLQDSRVLSCMYEFRAKDGDEGLAALLELRKRLEQQIKLMDVHGVRAVYEGRFAGFPVS